MLKLFHTADIHIGARNKYLGDDLFFIQKKFLKRLYENACSKSASFVVVAGDLFDSNYVPSSMAREVFDIFLSYDDVYTIIIPGGGKLYKREIVGHDAYTKDSIFRRAELKQYFKDTNIILLTPENRSIVLKDIGFYGGFFEIPYAKKLDALYHIGVLHGGFSELPLTDEISIKEIENLFFDYICLGHYHSYRKFNKSAYSGCLVQYEFLKKKKIDSGYVEVSIDDELNIQFIEFKDAPKFYKKDVLTLDDIDWIKSNLKDDIFVEIVGYDIELYSEIEDIISRNDNIKLSDNCIEYKRDGSYKILEESIDEVLKDYVTPDSNLSDDIKSFILDNIRGNITKPQLEEYLQNKFLYD